MEESTASPSEEKDVAPRANPNPARWLLRECIRANPLYVISAAFLGYGAQELTGSVDPQVGEASGALVALGLIHLYELSLLMAATVVLRRRNEGGRDVHGLLIVAALFLSGGLLALDEVLNLWPGWAPAWIFGALGAAGIKLWCYSRLPGLRLPGRSCVAAWSILCAHCLPALWASAPFSHWLRPEWAQTLGWLGTWLSLLPLIPLLGSELRAHTAYYWKFCVWNLSEVEVPRTHLPTVWLLGISLVMGQVHAFSADWIFDRSSSSLWHLAAGAVLVSLWLVYRHILRPVVDLWTIVLLLAPSAVACWSWPQLSVSSAQCHPCAQGLLAAGICTVLVSWTTRTPGFLAGLALPLGAPAWMLLQRYAAAVYRHRALISVAMGFLTLGAGVLISLYRNTLLQWISPPHISSTRRSRPQG